MPEMDGLEAARTIRASSHPEAKSIPIVVLSANAFQEDIQRSRAAGMNAHLVKPVSAETLIDVLRTFQK